MSGVGGIVATIVVVRVMTALDMMIRVGMDVMTMIEPKIIVICLDCEEQWDPDFEPSHCICWDPPMDAWMVFLKDDKGSWVRSMLDALAERHER